MPFMHGMVQNEWESCFIHWGKTLSQIMCIGLFLFEMSPLNGSAQKTEGRCRTGLFFQPSPCCGCFYIQLVLLAEAEILVS